MFRMLLLVLFLGMRHGMDPDHLATIDGLTRLNAPLRPRLARWSGALFSLGHGMVVTLAALLIGATAKKALLPGWLTAFGAGVSVFFLFFLGISNLIEAIRTPKNEVVRTIGWKGQLLNRLFHPHHPMMIFLIGALFALSFDTLTQTSLFSLAATRLSGWSFAVTAGLVFMAGMMIPDGLNGLWLSRLLTRSGLKASQASRVFSTMISGISFLVGGWVLAGLLFPGPVMAHEALWLSGAIVLVLLATSLLCHRFIRIPVSPRS